MLRRCVRHLRRSGSEISDSPAEKEGFVYHLELREEGGNRVRISLSREQTPVFAETVTLAAAKSRRQSAALARAVLDQIYTVRP